MALTINSKLADIVKDPKGKAILDKYCVGMSASPQFPIIQGMNLKDVAKMAKGKITPEMVKGVEEDLKKL